MPHSLSVYSDIHTIDADVYSLFSVLHDEPLIVPERRELGRLSGSLQECSSSDADKLLGDAIRTVHVMPLPTAHGHSSGGTAVPIAWSTLMT